jgi:hypothetical protein
VATGLVSLTPDAFFDHDWFFVVLGVTVALGQVWIALLARRLLAEAGGRRLTP